jgi:hypothetical protein
MIPSHMRQAFSDKCDGISDEVIHASLLEQGLTDDEAREIVQGLPALGAEKLEAANNSMLVGLYFLLGGIGLKLIMRSDMEQTLLNMITATLVITGLLKLADAWFRHGRYKWAKKK